MFVVEERRSVGLVVRYEEFGRRQLTVSCVANCVAVAEKLRNRIRKKGLSQKLKIKRMAQPFAIEFC